MNLINLKLFFCAFIMVFVASCSSTDKTILDDKSPSGKTFSSLLARLYDDLAQVQASKADWTDSAIFSRKSLRAAKGIHADPEHPQDWKVRDSMLAELVEARRILLDNVTGEAIKQEPQLSANAYFMYDCWIEQEENWWIEYMDSCKKEFYHTINQLYSVQKDVSLEAETLDINDLIEFEEIGEVLVDNEEIEEEIAPEEIKEEEVSEIPVEADDNIEDTEPPADDSSVDEPNIEEIVEEVASNVKTYVLYFSFDSDKLSKESVQTIKDIVAAIGISTPEHIVLNGHTDRSGSESYNLTLSEKRAKSVRTALVEYGEMGIDRIGTDIFGFGESDPARETEDGVKDPANRRVEVMFE